MRELKSRHASFAHQTGHQSALFAALIGPGSEVDVQVEVVTRTHDVLAKQACCVGLVNGRAQGASRVDKLATDVDVPTVGLGCEASNDHAFNEEEWRLLH